MAAKYRLLKKKAFESLEKFEIRLNDECQNGWRAISLSLESGSLIVLLERDNKL